MSVGNTERIDSSPAAHASDALAPLLQIAESAGHLLWAMDLAPTRHLSYLSPSFERIWGRTLDAAYADDKVWLQGIHPDDRPRVVTALDSLSNSARNARHDIEFRVLHPGGQISWLRSTVHAIVSATGEVTRLTGIAEDISARHEAEEAARCTEHYFHTLAHSLPQLLWACGADGKCNYLSPQWVSYTGVAALQQLSGGWTACMHPDDVAAVCATWNHAVDSAMAYAVEARIRRHDGAYRWFVVRGMPMRDGNGPVESWFGTCTDVDDLKQAHEAVQAERGRLSLIATASPSVLHSFRRSADGIYSVPFGSERLSELYALSAEAMRNGTALDEFNARLHPDDLAAFIASVDQSRLDGTPWRHEYRVQHPQRGELWVESHSRPVACPDGSVTWHGAITDITERKQVEAEVHRLNSELERRVLTRTAELQAAVKDLEAFSYSVSHDLRAPLRAIDGFSQVVLRECETLLPENGRRYLNIIRERAQKMGQLIDDLLAFSHLGRQPLSKHTIDTTLLVRDALQTLAPMHDGRSIELRLGDLPPSHCDPAMLRQVWVNLLSNALKYTRRREHAVIEIGSEVGDGSSTVFFVKDNGTGFDMRHANKLFGVFERLHHADEFEGTGVGLAIVQRIVQRHGGSVRAESVLGHGAAFYFRLEQETSPYDPV